jgi:hypothetical protein
MSSQSAASTSTTIEAMLNAIEVKMEPLQPL